MNKKKFNTINKFTQGFVVKSIDIKHACINIVRKGHINITRVGNCKWHAISWQFYKPLKLHCCNNKNC